jgi:hypothetical protein
LDRWIRAPAALSDCIIETSPSNYLAKRAGGLFTIACRPELFFSGGGLLALSAAPTRIATGTVIPSACAIRILCG